MNGTATTHASGAPKVPETSGWVVVLVAAAVLVVILTVGWLLFSLNHTNKQLLRSHQDTTALLSEIQTFTNPSSPVTKAESARTDALIAKVIVCIENHQDRVSAALLHETAPPVTPGCPAGD